MALNVTTAVFGENCNTATASPSLAQWDVGQILKIEGVDLPSAYQVEFSTEYTRNAIPRIGNAAGVAIPNELLQRSAPITAYIVLHEGENDRETEYWITIHITPRTPPETITPDPEELSVIDETIAALQEGVADAEAAATSAEGSASDAADHAADAEAWAVGQRAGADVPDTDPTYHNNSKYYAGAAEAAAEEAGRHEASWESWARRAETAAGNAEGSATAAGQSKAAAEAAAQTATQKATAAGESATAAAGSAAEARQTVDGGVGAINTARDGALSAIGQAGTTQTGAVNQAGANQVAAVNQAGATQVQAVEDKGDEVLDSIPQDYSELVDDVADLSRHLSDVENDIRVFNSFPVAWSQGNIILSNGASGGSAGATYNKRVRSGYIEAPDNGFKVSLPDNIWIQCFWYTEQYVSAYIDHDERVITENLISPRGKYVRFMLGYSDDTLDIHPADADVGDVIVYKISYTDTSLTMSGKPADAKTVGDRLALIETIPIIVASDGRGNYASFTQALYENYDTKKDIIVKAGTYDIVAEYVALFGQNVVDSLADSTENIKGFQYGIRIYDHKITFEAGAKLVCDWTGHTVNGTHRFSALAPSRNCILEGLYLECTGTFYAAHDDYGGTVDRYKNVYKNCVIIASNLYNDNVIGGGCGKYSETIIDNCYFTNGNTSGTTLRYHNTGIWANAEPIIRVSNTFCGQGMSFRWYGNQTTKMKVYVNNCQATYISKGAEGATENDNVELYTWNNEVGS